MLFDRAVGGSSGGEQGFGHTALRIYGKGYDVTFDYFRGAKPEGAAIGHGPAYLSVETDVGKWLAFNKRHGRVVAVDFPTSQAFDRAVIDYFSQKIAKGNQVAQSATGAVYDSGAREDCHPSAHENWTTPAAAEEWLRASAACSGW